MFRPHYRLYSGAFVDVVYDHFLANDQNEFGEGDLLEFSFGVYSVLDEFKGILPERFASFFPYMKMQNWLYNYRTVEGTSRSFGGLVRRARYLTDSREAENLFVLHYQLLADCYRQFWQDLKPFAQSQFDIIRNTDRG